MSDPLTPLVLSRRPRTAGTDWDSAKSWLGGLPKLGGLAWPRTAADRPMWFLAQVDLGEIADRMGPGVLPAEGALAFFISMGKDEWSPRVLYVKEPRPAPTEPPADAPAAFERGGDIFPESADPSAPRAFPRWPIDFTLLPALAEKRNENDEDDEWSDRRMAAISAVFKRRPYFLSANEAYKTLGDAPRPAWWHTAQLLAEYLNAALRSLPARIEQQKSNVTRARGERDKLRPPRPLLGFGRRTAEPTPQLKQAEDALARREAVLKAMQDNAPAFSNFVAEMSGWVRAADPWAAMPADAVARLRTAYDRSRKEFDDFTRYRVPSTFDDIETDTLRTMLTGDARAYTMIPEPVRDLINETYLLPTSGTWHQMFGVGVDIQSNAALENEGNVMLMQLVYDDMMGWRFGDMGAYQFWIPPGDLAVGNWKAVRLTFEAS